MMSKVSFTVAVIEFRVLFVVMEVINGDYGDGVVPKLMQAVATGECDAFNDRYKVCIPKPYGFSPSRSSKNRTSSCNLSTIASSYKSGSGSLEESLLAKSSASSYGDAGEDSSKESSEDVSGTTSYIYSLSLFLCLYISGAHLELTVACQTA